MKYLVIALLILTLTSCKQDQVGSSIAQMVVDKSIDVSGGSVIESATIAFDFRDKHYKAVRDKGLYQLEREFKDSINTIRDVLSNSGFKRFVNSEAVKVADSMIPRYSSSVNSVHYFSLLPYGLNDEAVNKTYLGDVTIKGTSYYKIKVSFDEAGGGEDHEDVFVYWIDTETDTVDYLAYSYSEADGLGFRFREAYNERYIKGVRFVDYNNYKPKNNTIDVRELDTLFESGSLELLSKIELKNISVE